MNYYRCWESKSGYSYRQPQCIPGPIPVTSPKLTASEIELAKKIINEMALMVVKGEIEIYEKMFSKYGSFGMELVENILKVDYDH